MNHEDEQEQNERKVRRQASVCLGQTRMDPGVVGNERRSAGFRLEITTAERQA